MTNNENKIHSDSIKKLKKIGEDLGFLSGDGVKLGKMYHMGNPDCVWYYDCRRKEPLMKIVRGDRCDDKKCKKHNKNSQSGYLPIIAFEVPNSENEKALRGSLMTLQLANASASVIVLIGKAAEKHEQFTNKLGGRYSSMRLRIWPENYVDDLYKRILKKEIAKKKKL
jgi:hypothetical protein